MPRAAPRRDAARQLVARLPRRETWPTLWDLGCGSGLSTQALVEAAGRIADLAGDDRPETDVAGVALPVEIAVGTGKKATRFHEDLLFTHRGLSGPAVLQISSYWEPGQPLTINLAPHTDLAQQLKDAKQGSRKQLSTAWSQALPDGVPQRLAQTWLEQAHLQQPSIRADASLAEMKDRNLDWLGSSANSWQITPNGTEGYAKAEVTRGGVSTQALSSQTMGSKTVQGLYFIGEVVDVTGWLGGYNFQWAWASAMACARALGKMTP